MQFSSSAISSLCYFAIFANDPVANDLKGLCILSHTDVTVTVEASVVSYIRFHPTKTNFEGGSYYPHKVIYFKLFMYCSNFDSGYAY